MRKKTMNTFFEIANIDSLLCAFINAKPCDGGFIIESSYKETKYRKDYRLKDEDYQENNRLMQEYFDLEFELKGKKHQYFIQTDLGSNDFFKKVYQEILRKRISDEIDEKAFQQKMLLAFFVPRGSFDLTAKFFTIDLIRKIISDIYLDLLFKLLTNITDLRQLNLNFRELQEQYITGENKRNTQLRINLRYFFEIAFSDIKKINSHKYQIFKQNENEIKQIEKKDKLENGFIERLLFYKQNVLHQDRDDIDIEKLRQDLGFEYQESDKQKRDSSIVKIAKKILKEECASCCDDYRLEDRTFKYRNSDYYYLEIHHCISFSSNNKFDQIDNLVKLCPACHRALTKNRADEDYQKNIIKNILEHSPQIKDFCLNFTSETNLVEFIYKRLA